MKATFGQTLRAHRLGFRRTDVGWVRIGNGPGEDFVASVCPFGIMPRSPSGVYYAWWEGDVKDKMEILNPIYNAFDACEVKDKQVNFVMSDAGEVIRRID